MKVTLMGKIVHEWFRAERHPSHCFIDTKLKVLINERKILNFVKIKEIDIPCGLSVSDYIGIEDGHFKIEKIVARQDELLYYIDYDEELTVDNESKKVAMDEINEALKAERLRLGGNYV